MFWYPNSKKFVYVALTCTTDISEYLMNVMRKTMYLYRL